MAKKRVICALSGGVDSSVAAGLLKKRGYEVIGLFMKLWAEETDRTDLVRENVCCSAEAATAARAVAQKLDIPFYVVNFAADFKKMVVDNYIKEYDAGRTPNPCVICNRDIKGELLFAKMKELDADFLATGHYAQVKFERDKYHLYQSVDTAKDQTYFLWMLTQEKLARLLFPVGHLTKAKVRQLAHQWQLPTASRRESQGICFIPDRDVGRFLRRYARVLTKPGPIVDKFGRTLGQHQGLINYTVGQRERLGLGSPRAYYVLKLKSQDNTLVVGDEADLYAAELVATNLNWLNLSSRRLGARIRYGHPISECRIQKIGSQKMKVSFSEPQRAITPGQSVVFYAGEELIGGGIIE